MEHVEGQTVETRLERGPLDLSTTLAITRQVLAGLAEAHRQGILHCDIKASNVILDETGRVRILDFGLARDVSGSFEPSDVAYSGTLPYLPPECVSGAGGVDVGDLTSLISFLFLGGSEPAPCP